MPFFEVLFTPIGLQFVWVPLGVAVLSLVAARRHKLPGLWVISGTLSVFWILQVGGGIWADQSGNRSAFYIAMEHGNKIQSLMIAVGWAILAFGKGKK